MTFEVLSQHLDAFLALKVGTRQTQSALRGRAAQACVMKRGSAQLSCTLAAARVPMAYPCRLAMDGMMEGSTLGRPDRNAHRLLTIGAIVHHVRTLEEQTGVPQIQFRRRYKWLAPYIFSDQEIQQMMEATVRKQTPFRPVTVRTIIGLLASTAIRIGEALRLATDDVRLDASGAEPSR